MRNLADRVIKVLGDHEKLLLPAIRQLMAEAWDEGAEAATNHGCNQSTPSGIPIDPPSNPYEAK